MGTIIGIMGTLITNRSKMNELKELINDSSDKKLIDNLKVLLEKNDLFLNKLSTIEQIKTLPANCDKIENLLNKINAIENHLETKTITINDARKSSEAFFEDRPESLNEMGSIAAVRETMSNEFTNVKTLIIVLAAVSIIMPLIKNNLF